MARDTPKRKSRLVKANHSDNYFTLPHPIWMVVISFGLWLLVITTINADKIPSILGPLTTFAQYVGKQHPQVCYGLCVFTVVAHCGEALYASKLCQDKGLSVSASIKWTLSTMIFGFSSLLRLVPYSPVSKQH